VHEHCAAGADSADAIGERCGAGWGCGTCVDRLKEILERSAANSVAA